jgi:formate dehydrogenase maturation protein FdhE
MLEVGAPRHAAILICHRALPLFASAQCRSYVKILDQRTDPALDPVADDVASLDLDLLVRETGLRRGGVDHFLLGY